MERGQQATVPRDGYTTVTSDPSPETATPRTPYVSVIMAIRNESESIERSLRAVLEQDYPHDRMEVIVADGMSADGTRDAVAALACQHSNVRLIDNPAGIVSTGLNRAIAVARGEIIVRVDGHTLIGADYVSQSVRVLRTAGADCVGGPMKAEGRGWFGRAVARATSSRFGVGGGRFHYSDRQEWVDTVYMGAWWRRTFEQIGAFDEHMVRNQDDEFSYRLLDRGGRILLTPTIRSTYAVRGTPRSLWRQYFEYGYWKVRVMRLHPRQMRLRQCAPPAFVLALVSAGLAALGGPGGRVFLVALVSVYGVANLGASLQAAGRGEPGLVPGLVLAYAVLHLSYGTGFLTGLLRSAAGVLVGKSGRR